jgi:hypothetical protein
LERRDDVRLGAYVRVLDLETGAETRSTYIGEHARPPGADGSPFAVRLKKTDRLRGMFAPGRPPASLLPLDVYVDRTLRRASLRVDVRRKGPAVVVRLR